MPRINIDIRKSVVNEHQNGYSQRFIAKKFGISRFAVANILNKYNLHKSVEDSRKLEEREFIRRGMKERLSTLVDQTLLLQLES